MTLFSDVVLDEREPAEESVAEPVEVDATSHKSKHQIRFTSRKMECIQQLMKRKSPAEIGKNLRISERTIEFYFVNAMKKVRRFI